MGENRGNKGTCVPTSPLVILIFLLTCNIISGCTMLQSTSSEILIALKPEVIPLLIQPKDTDPFNTGIPSLDTLNRKWNVQEMILVFTDISPDDEAAARYGLAGIYKLVVPRNTNIAAMIQDYQSDTHIDYAEINHPYEIK